MFVKIISFLSHLSSLFSTIASSLLFQVTMASCPGFYGSPLLAFFYLIWPPLQSISKLQPELLFQNVDQIVSSHCLKSLISNPTDFRIRQTSQAHKALPTLPCLGLQHQFAWCSLSPLTLHLSGLLSIHNKYYVLSFYRALCQSVPFPGRLFCSLIWFPHVNPLDPV